MSEQPLPPQKNVNEEITENIKSGQYFKDAIDWYTIKFIQPVTHRSYFIFITTFSLIFSFMAFRILSNILPVVETLPIVLETESMADYYMKLQKLGNELEDPNISVLRYMTGRYIIMRENYDFTKLQSNLNFVKNFSSKEEYERYRSYMKPETPESPILKYRSHTRRIVTVSKEHGEDLVTMIVDPTLQLPPNMHRMVAFFTAKEAGPAAGPETAWKASLDVKFSDVVFYKDKKAFSPMDFEVTRYEVEQVVNKR
jgi:type IV secretory pathway component VirB8